MRQKFGASNGLRSGGGGGMQGIGSDPSYRPGEGGSGRGGGAPDINEIGANAFSFVSSWADTITKVSFLVPALTAVAWSLPFASKKKN
jgi:hypothetical protein